MSGDPQLEHVDGTTSTLLLTPASARRRGATVLVLPGIAVGARYYRPLAERLAENGFDVGTTELRGQGDSTYVPRHGSAPAGFHETAAYDIPLALDHLERAFGDQPTVLLGHSMGAQLALYHLARRDRRVAAYVGVATQSPYFRGFAGTAARRLRLGAKLLPVLGRRLGYVPERFFGAEGKQPAARIIDWAQLAGHGEMQPARADIDYPATLRAVTVPGLLVTIEGDTEAPNSASRNLAALIPSAPVRIEHESEQLGHNRWARHPGRIVDRLVRWYDSEVTRPPGPSAQGT